MITFMSLNSRNVMLIMMVDNKRRLICFHSSLGVKDPEQLLEQIDSEIAKVKEEASSRKEILEKVEKWMTACEEESWLEEYNRVRHFNLKLFVSLLKLFL